MTVRPGPLAEADVDPKVLESMAPWRIDGKLFNVFLTFARHPALSTAWGPWGAYVFARSTLTPRQRELLIVRTTWLTGSEYEFAHHAIVAGRRDVTEDEVVRITQGPDADGWTPVERALLRAADELHRDAVVSDATWDELADHLDERGVMDVVFTCGTYRIGSTFMRTFGVPLEDDFPDSPVLDQLRRSINAQ